MGREIDAIVLLDRHAEVEQLLSFTRTTDLEEALASLSEAVTTNSLWTELGSPARLVVRSTPTPTVAAVGFFTPPQREQLLDLAAQLNEAIQRHRYIDYPEAEAATTKLAERLRLRFSAEELGRFRFTAIPRGGIIVLGMLSYTLEIPAAQLLLSAPRRAFGLGGRNPEEETAHADESAHDIVVVVDDCALSGVRFRQFLADIEAEHVVFCPLFAPDELCSAIERNEPRVSACLNAESLLDLAPERYQKSYAAWHAERTARMQDHGYWVGAPEYIAFAWSEPEARRFVPSHDRVEPGWSLLPPRLCLARRVRAGDAPAESRRSCVVKNESSGVYRPADGVIWTWIDSAVVVARLPTVFDDSRGHAAAGVVAPACFRLEHSAAAVWMALMEHSTVEEVERAFLERFDLEPSRAREDLWSFTSKLEAEQLIMRRE